MCYILDTSHLLTRFDLTDTVIIVISCHSFQDWCGKTTGIPHIEKAVRFEEHLTVIQLRHPQK